MTRVTNESGLSRERSASRRAILSAGIEVFADRGRAGARVEDIVRRSGVNVRMLYHHFGSKEGLYEQVVRELFKLTPEMRSDREQKCAALWLQNRHACLVKFLAGSSARQALVAWELADLRARAEERPAMAFVLPLLTEPLSILVREEMIRTDRDSIDLAQRLLHQATYLLRLSSAAPFSDLNHLSQDQLIDSLWNDASREILQLAPHRA